MSAIDGLQGKRPRFYKEPTDEDIEINGWAIATVNARVRARIIGSRLVAATVTVSIGAVLTAYEVLTNTDINPYNLIPNFVVPAIINTVAEIKVERQLNHTAQEVGKLLEDILNTGDGRDDNLPPLNET